MAQSPLKSIRNHGLFSNHYLSERIGENDEWHARDEVEQAWERAGEIWALERDNVESYNEADLEKSFIHKILEGVLDHHFRMQLYAEGKRPDYGFFATRQEKKEATKQGDRFYEHAFALGDAKRWKISLSHVATQIYDYLGRIRGVKWAILTNGRHWRLYSSESKHIEEHYEVDLVNILLSNNFEEFRYFYFFFRREAFVAKPGAQCFLERVMAGSVRFTEGVEKDLRNRVYEALRVLAEGFVQFSREGGKTIATDAETLEALKQSMLHLLYRLLFLLYAESRGLLAADREPYRGYSLDSIQASVENGTFRRYQTTLWGRLKDLFSFINSGHRELDIPPYNGGLFDPAKAPFLETYHIDDPPLAEAIQLLSLTGDDRHSRIDYRDLGVRQLGSIYEGILEYRLTVASESMVAVKEKGREKWIREADHRPRGRHRELPRAAAGELYLVTDRGERKATGSYYTPDYIVQYIVENTVGPLVEEKRKAHAEAQAVATRGERDPLRPLWRELLELKVLDPAMGSGHFLVAATEFLARAVVRARTDEEGDDWTADPAQTGGEEAIVWARREVARHCIFGVDLNPMAVELAKLSLWLETISRDKPLSFLDHHLKCGNSLIGARLRDLPLFPGLKGKGAEKVHDEHFDWWKSIRPESFIQKLTEALKEIEGKADDTLEGIKEKERLHEELKKSHRYRKLRIFLNVHTAHYFGLGLLEEGTLKKQIAAYKKLRVKAARAKPEEWEEYRGFEKAVRHAKLAEQKRFFHWELEFPEAFFEGTKLKENPGFDAVIGNPPYVRIYRGRLAEDDVTFYKNKYRTARMKFDIYVVFLELAIELSSRRGSYIVPDKFMVTPYGWELRKKLLFEVNLEKIVDLRGISIFRDASVDCVIPVFSKRRKHEEDSKMEVINAVVDKDNRYAEFYLVRTCDKKLFNFTPQNIIRLEVNASVFSLFRNIRKRSFRLNELHYVNWGLRTGTYEKSEKMITDTPIDGRSRPMVRGSNILTRYDQFYTGSYIHYVPEILYNPLFPELFENDKIFIRKISGQFGLMAVVDRNKYYGFSTVIVVIPHRTLEEKKEGYRSDSTIEDNNKYKLDYSLSIINSRLIRFYYDKLLSDELSVVPNQIKELPIRRIAFTTPAAGRDRLAGEARALYDKFCSTFNDSPLLDFVAVQLFASPERSDVVHDLLAHLAEVMLALHREKQKRLGQFRDELSGLLDEAQLAKLNRLYTPSREPQRKEDEARRRFARRHEKWTGTMADTKRALGGLAAGRLEFADVWRLDERQFGWCVRQKLRLTRGMADVLGAFRRFVADDTDGLAPLMRRIAATDALIDQIVYRLYGLTEEEIAVVEGRA